jgi:hypothetical protein
VRPVLPLRTRRLLADAEPAFHDHLDEVVTAINSDQVDARRPSHPREHGARIGRPNETLLPAEFIEVQTNAQHPLADLLTALLDHSSETPQPTNAKLTASQTVRRSEGRA